MQSHPRPHCDASYNRSISSPLIPVCLVIITQTDVFGVAYRIIITLPFQLNDTFLSLVLQRIFGFSMGSTLSCSSAVLSLRAKCPLLSHGSLSPRLMSEKRNLNLTSHHAKKSLNSFHSGMFVSV